MSCWPQTPTPCKLWCFSPFWWPAPAAFLLSRNNRLWTTPWGTMLLLSLKSETKEYLFTILDRKSSKIFSFPEVKQEVSSILRPHQDTKVKLQVFLPWYSCSSPANTLNTNKRMSKHHYNSRVRQVFFCSLVIASSSKINLGENKLTR